MTDKVVPLKQVKKEPKDKFDGEIDFEQIMKDKAINEERVKKEREKDNKSVIRSYRLKGKDD